MSSEVYTAMARSLKAFLARNRVVAYVYHKNVNRRLYVRLEDQFDRVLVPKQFKGWDVVVEATQ